MTGATSEHFTAAELSCRHCSVNGAQPALVTMLEWIRAEAGRIHGNVRIDVHSAYRCQAHNAATPNAAKNSIHQQGLAADIVIRVMGEHAWYYLTPAEMEAIARRCPILTGIGRSDKKPGYVHVDARAGATNANPAAWCYSDSGASIAYFPPRQVQSA